MGEEVRQDPAFADDIVSDVDVPGLDRVGNGEAEYLMLVKTRPTKQFGVSRELRRRIKECFEKNNVQAAGPGRVYVVDQGRGRLRRRSSSISGSADSSGCCARR